MESELRRACAEICAPARIEAAIEMSWYSPPILFDKDCVAAVKQAAGAAGYGNMEIVSGAGHDACYVSRVAPTAMIFVPGEEGGSHNESERATPEDLAAGSNVQLYASLTRARVIPFPCQRSK